MKLNPKAIQTVFFVFHDPEAKPKTEVYVLTGEDLERWLRMAKNSNFSPLPPDTNARIHPSMPFWDVPKGG